MQKKRSNNRGEPRKGALVVSIVLVVIVIMMVALYFISVPDRKTNVSEVDKSETQPVITKKLPLPPPTHQPLPKPKPQPQPQPQPLPLPQPLPQPVVTPPVVKKKPTDRQTYPIKEPVPPAEKPFAGAKQATARLAIIIDDMGSSLSEARSLAAIKVPLTFSVIPGLRSYRDVALFAGSKGIETMLHIPMQSKGWPERRLEANGLLVSMGDAEIKERVTGLLRDLPGAIGVNNHMGSEFMEHEEKVQSLLETLKKRGIFFVDSVTSPESTGFRLAHEMGIKSERRHVFLDNVQERAYIMGQLGQAVKLAKKNGYAIAICHPHPETISTLASALPGLSARGVTLVPVSQLVR